jgi:hypothetical protein
MSIALLALVLMLPQIATWLPAVLG